MFDFGILHPFVIDDEITDVDTNGKCVYVTHQLEGRKKVLDLERGYLENLLNRISNYDQIDREFNYHNPILDGTMDGLRVHAVHNSAMDGCSSLSIRKNPFGLVVLEEDYIKIFELIKIANKLKWSYAFGGERGTGKTQWMRTSISLFETNETISIIAENDEMHMQDLLPDRLIHPYIVNDIMDYRTCAASVLRDDSDYVVFQEVRDRAIDDLFLILSSSSRVLTTLHVKNALLMPERMIELSEQKNSERLRSIIHDYVQMCIVPSKEFINGKVHRYISEIALFWNDKNHNAQKQLIYTSNGNEEIFLPLPDVFLQELISKNLTLSW